LTIFKFSHKSYLIFDSIYYIFIFLGQHCELFYSKVIEFLLWWDIHFWLMMTIYRMNKLIKFLGYLSLFIKVDACLRASSYFFVQFILIIELRWSNYSHTTQIWTNLIKIYLILKFDFYIGFKDVTEFENSLRKTNSNFILFFYIVTSILISIEEYLLQWNVSPNTSTLRTISHKGNQFRTKIVLLFRF